MIDAVYRHYYIYFRMQSTRHHDVQTEVLIKKIWPIDVDLYCGVSYSIGCDVLIGRRSCWSDI